MKKEKLVRKCILCGKEIENGIICKECSVKMEQKNRKETKKERYVDIEVCECGRYREKGEKWKFPNFIRSNKKGEYIDMLLQEINERGINVRSIKRAKCDSCSRQAGGYYEAIIQIRGKEEFVERIIDKIEKETIKSLENNAFITNINFLKGGADIYIGSKKIAQRTAKKIKRTEKATIKRTSSLYGLKDGKRIYRDTILIREEDRNEQRKHKRCT